MVFTTCHGIVSTNSLMLLVLKLVELVECVSGGKGCMDCSGKDQDG